MPQKTNLNVNPYYDDFSKDDNFYKVLFKPGFPVQARELTGLQSILQNQIESFGSHIFKEGSMVIPGGITCDNEFTTVKVNRDHLGIDVSVYLDAIVGANNGKGAEVFSENTKIRAKVKGYLLPPQEGVEEITLFVKYAEAGSNDATVFEDGEVLILQDNISYGNTAIVSGDTVFTLNSVNATNTGYAVGVDAGVFFTRGSFVDSQKSQIILDPYNNEPSFRVGFDVVEDIVNSDQEPKINDNAKGFTNFAAPGADRLRFKLVLTKKLLTDTKDTTFIELVRIEEGKILKVQDTSTYSEIRKYFAKRTFEESGNYAVDNFIVDVVDLLNDETGNGGVFTEGEVTDDGNVPKEENMGIRVSAGTAYVKGFDVDHVGNSIIDVPKPRTTKPLQTARIPFAGGSLLRVNNVYGTPYINIGQAASGSSSDNIISLYSERRDGNGSGGTLNGTGQGTAIGYARVYWYGLTDAPVTASGNYGHIPYDLYLYDIQTFTRLLTTNTIRGTDAPRSSFVRGLSSGATGYLTNVIATNGASNDLKISQTSGVFLRGEQIIINESVTTSIMSVTEYDISDVKSVHQDCSSLNSALVVDFLADTVLYEQPIPDFGPKDLLTINNSNEGTVAGRFFAGAQSGIKVGSIIKYSVGAQSDPVFNKVTDISSDGKTLTLTDAPESIPGVNHKSVTAGSHQFSLVVPEVLEYGSNGLYSPLPVENIASLDLANADLTITKQITGKTPSNNELTLNVSDALDTNAGISSVFFEAFDQERYSVTDTTNGRPIAIDFGMFNLGPDAESITFTNLPNNPVTVNVTLKKQSVTNKVKDFTRSAIIDITRTSGVSQASGLTKSLYYGTRVEDNEISLNVPDVVNVRAIYESTDTDRPVLDKLTFSTGLALDQNVIVGEKIIGSDSRAVAQVVSASNTVVEYIPLNANTFIVGETVTFKESSVEAVIQITSPGSYLNVTPNYRLDKGHRHQYCDYSRIVRRPGSPTPSKKLLIVFDHYTVGSSNDGDIFTVNSYTSNRFKSDIPTLPNGLRVSDIIDFRPRVAAFDPSTTNASPFAFTSREYEYNYKYVITPDETSFVGYTYYLPRIDLVTMNKLGDVEVIQGVPDDEPKAPVLSDDSMELAQVLLPSYLFNVVNDPQIILKDNRRFTMRDIGKLEDRIETLEEVTSLTMLELSAKTTDITDANGLSRFKSGFIVSDFRNKSLMDPRLSTVDISESEGVCVAPVELWSMDAELNLHPDIDVENADLDQNLLLPPGSGCQKTGDLITLEYTEKEWIIQPQATTIENVNPYQVIAYVGGVILDPASDNWVRTIYINDHRTEETGAKWIHKAKTTKDVDTKTTFETYDKGGGRGEKGTRKVKTKKITLTTKYKRKLKGPSREFDYVEDVKVSGEADPWMRSRNVAFYANGLRSFQRHYFYLDSQQVDVVPKLFEIEMSSGTFQAEEEINVYDDTETKVGFMKIGVPNQKIKSDRSREVSAGLGSPATNAEKYTVDPFDKERVAPGSSYSPTSRLMNIKIQSLARKQKYYGYVKEGFKVVGATSGAVAKITDTRLMSDNWGDILGCFFIRDPNSNPKPAIRVKTGDKTIKITALPPSKTKLPGSTKYASEALGYYSGTGTILTQETSKVSVRNPPKPKRKKTEVEKKTKVVHRDPLAQSFRVDDTNGVFLTSFDLYFASKDPNAKIFFELRTMELGTPTSFLVQDYAQTSLNPADINVNSEADQFNLIPTNIKFESPVYLEPDTEYAIVVLAPSSDLYEVWTAEMNENTVQTSNFPDVEQGRVSKQYIGGSLFKSQNGTIWTPNQYQDMTFKLYKAEFASTGTVEFFNTEITPVGDNAQRLNENPIESYPRKLKLPVTGTLNAAVVKGTRVAEGSALNTINGYVEDIGGDIATTQIADKGASYKPGTTSNNVPLISLTGKGEGATANILTDSDGLISTVTIANAGSGYVEGETLGITTASMGGNGGAAGSGAKITVGSINNTTTLYLTNVQGEHFTNTSDIYYYNTATTTTDSGVDVNGASSLINDRFSGNLVRVKQQNHAHHGGTNLIKIEGILPDTAKTTIVGNFGPNDTTISVANTTVFTTYEGITTSRGYALIGDEVVQYSAINSGTGDTGTLSISARGQNSTVTTEHQNGIAIQPYEVNGISLMRINTQHSLPANYYTGESSNLDYYNLEIDRSGLFPIARETGNAMVNFEAQKGFGGNKVGISQNHQYSSIEPRFNIITPGKGTKADTFIRTVSGTSAGGTEVSFLDQGFEPITLNKTTKFNTPRIIGSRVNELRWLQQMPRNKSLTLRVELTSEDPNVSPVLDLQNSVFVLGRNKTNYPVSDYIEDGSANLIEGDPHGQVFVTKSISLAKLSTSLKVIIAANRQEGADFRVLYQLFRADSSGIDQKFVPFPGYDNLIDDDGDGFGDRVRDPSKNSGRADAFVPANDAESYSEYQFTANNLEQFSAFAIKIVMSSTNESTPVKLQDFRAIALA